MAINDDKDKNMAPGWNDPPFLSYSTLTPQPTRLLNKRILHPEIAITSNSNENTNGFKPPEPFFEAQLTNKSSIPFSLPQNEVYQDSVDNKDFIFTAIRSCLEKCHKNTQVSIPIFSEMNKKINIFFKEWDEDKLNLDIKSKMYKLSEALSQGKLDEAYDIHVILMAQYAFQINSWLIGIKKMIMLTKEQKMIQEGF